MSQVRRIFKYYDLVMALFVTILLCSNLVRAAKVSPPPKLIKSRILDSYCEKILAILKEPQFGQQMKAVLALLDKTHKLWTQKGGSRFGIKDNREFTDLLY